MGGLVWKVLGTGSALMASNVTRNALEKAWRKATGTPPPQNPVSRGVTAGQAIAWAVVSGALVQVVRMLTIRQAARFYEKSAGHLPKQLQDVG